MTAPDKMKRALKEVEALVLTYADNMEYDAFRLLLSERAELLATVEKMRAGLEKVAAYYPPGHRIEELARAALTTGEATTPNAGERG